jgi:hypothetical protein
MSKIEYFHETQAEREEREAIEAGAAITDRPDDIDVCVDCGGTGTVGNDARDPQDAWWDDCPWCVGTGRYEGLIAA